jgi:hypothetical protein
MTERLISPGVYTTENEQPGVPRIANVPGAVVVGPTTKGPAFVPVTVTSIADLESTFGKVTPDNYTTLTAYNYLRNAPSVTVVRVLGNGSGYSFANPINVVAEYKTSGSTPVTSSIAFLHPTQVVTTEGSGSPLFETSVIDTQLSGSISWTLSGSFQVLNTLNGSTVTTQNGLAFTASLESASDNQFSNVFSASPRTLDSVYLSSNFKNTQKAIKAIVDTAGHEVNIKFETGSATDYVFSATQLTAATPWITSQKISNTVTDLIKFHTLSAGLSSNHEVKISIENIKAAGTIAGSSYGAFDVVVRTVDQTFIPASPFENVTETVVEQFRNVNLDTQSANYIAKVIGDKYSTVTSTGKVETFGDYATLSRYIRVEVAESVSTRGIARVLVPFGFRAPYSPIPSSFTQPAACSYVSNQRKPSGIPSKTVAYGFSYNFSTAASGSDNLNYLCPLPTEALQSTGSNSPFYLGDYTASSDLYTYTGSVDLVSSDLDARKFVVPLQGGSDGMKPNTYKAIEDYITSTNVFGYDISSTSASGYSEWKKAIDVLANKDIVDFNILVTPGIVHRIHSALTVYALEMIETRADAVYILDACEYDKNVDTVINSIQDLDSSYVATYYPWLKMTSPGSARPVKVPPSVVVPAVYAQNDTLGQPWFVPAGLTRGTLSFVGVTDVQNSITAAEKGTLYENRVNPIYISTNGPIIWGQKTLQGKPSALSSINVRRLLIELKKFIGNVSKTLVFEQNTATTRQRFLNIVNPYLDGVQQKQGLYSYNVVMDETNNGPSEIDRGLLVAEIYIQPARAAEFIVLNFNIQPTGVDN